MRYLWPVLIVLFVLFSIDFATQNPEVVVVKYSLEWLNYGIRSERPLFVTLYLTLALGILFSVLYFLVYHTKLLAQMRKLRGEIKKLQKQLE
ncbi:MAG: LapA family protein, partial [SAR324 cluster bacterium]|nr:LapA family protein [SAR324 cluster bacterium]